MLPFPASRLNSLSAACLTDSAFIATATETITVCLPSQFLPSLLPPFFCFTYSSGLALSRSQIILLIDKATSSEC